MIKLVTFLALTIFVFVNNVNSQVDSLTIDSFDIQKKILEWNYQVEQSQFDSLLMKLHEFGDIHEYVLERIEENRRTPIMHEYYPAYLNFICKNMDSTYRKGIIEKIQTDSIERYLAYPIVKSCLFETTEETCKYLNSINIEEKYIQTKSLLYESLVKLKNEMKCSM